MSPRRKPIGANTPYTEVCLRVAARLIQLDYRRNPSLYLPHRPSGVLDLCERVQKDFVELRPFFHYYARNIAYGYTLETLRDNAPEYTMRSIAKLKPARSARRS